MLDNAERRKSCKKDATSVHSTDIYEKCNLHMTGVINDPLGHTHSLASSEHCFRLKFVLL